MSEGQRLDTLPILIHRRSDGEEIVVEQTVDNLRDWFAGHASDEDIRDMQLCKDPGMISRQDARYMVADAMLKARSK